MKQFKIIVDCTDAILTTMSCEGWQVNHLQFEAGILRAVFSRNVKPVPVVGGGVINRTLEGLGDFRPMGEGADADAVVVADALMSGELVLDEGEKINHLVAVVAERVRQQAEELENEHNEK